MRCFAILLAAAPLFPQDIQVPRPEDYPVSAVFTGTPAAPRFATAGQRRFRTVIRDWVRKGPNFAGHYAIAEWGCGTGCGQMAMVDVQNGAVYEGPLGVLPKGEICLGAGLDEDKAGIFYSKNSSLLVLRGCPNFEKCGTYYYVWNGARFKLMRNLTIKEPFGCGES